MVPILTSSEMKAADLYTVNEIGIPSMVLMEHAAQAVLLCLEHRYQSVLPGTKGVILAGSGNNGGDALAVARLLYQRGIRHFEVVLPRRESELSSLCAEQLRILKNLGMGVRPSLNEEYLGSCDWIIDGLYGIGLTRSLNPQDQELIKKLNDYSGKKWIVSVDIPSGLCADSGQAMPIAVQASETVTLGYYKRGVCTGVAANHVGRITLAPIQIPREAVIDPHSFLYTQEDLKQALRRPEASHKGMFGHVFVYGGTKDKEGASVLAALGALRTGAGLVTVIGEETLRDRLAPEVMLTKAIPKTQKGHVVVAGPGLGTGHAEWQIIEELLTTELALVLDADAMSLVAEHEEAVCKLLLKREGKGGLTFFTPHPKEAARLLGSDVPTIESDRFKAIEELTKRYHGYFLLKGKGSLVKGIGQDLWIVNQGNSGLSKGGMGDLLSGMIAGMVAQGNPPMLSLAFSAFCHGYASCFYSKKFGTERATLPSDLIQILPEVFGELGV